MIAIFLILSHFRPIIAWQTVAICVCPTKAIALEILIATSVVNAIWGLPSQSCQSYIIAHRHSWLYADSDWSDLTTQRRLSCSNSRRHWRNGWFIFWLIRVSMVYTLLQENRHSSCLSSLNMRGIFSAWFVTCVSGVGGGRRGALPLDKHRGAKNGTPYLGNFGAKNGTPN